MLSSLGPPLTPGVLGPLTPGTLLQGGLTPGGLQHGSMTPGKVLQLLYKLSYVFIVYIFFLLQFSRDLDIGTCVYEYIFMVVCLVGLHHGGMTPGGLQHGEPQDLGLAAGMTPAGLHHGGMTPGLGLDGGMTPAGLVHGGLTPAGLHHGGMTPG